MNKILVRKRKLKNFIWTGRAEKTLIILMLCILCCIFLHERRIKNEQKNKQESF